MIGVALGLALAFQNMSQQDLIFQGENLGRLAAAAGACAAVGYEVDQSIGDRLVESYGAAARASGWSEDVAIAAIEAGAAREQAEIGGMDPPENLPDSDLRRFAEEKFARYKERCRDLDWRYPGVIVDLEQGDRNADARLAIMLRPLDE